MEFLEPVHCICDEEVLDFVAAQVENVGAPVWVFALARVGVLVAGCAVEAAEGVCVLGEVCRNPVQNHADFSLVAEVHKVAELVRGAVAAGGGIVARHLVAPGFVERVFGERQKFNVRVAHFLEVRNQAFGKFIPVEEAVRICRVAAPGTGVDFVDVHRATEYFCGPVGFHIKFVAPFVTVEVRCDGGCGWANFTHLCERVHLHVEVPVGSVDFEAVEFALAEVRNEDFPNAACAKHAHLVAVTVPAVEVADDGNGLGVRCPYGELHSLEALVFHKVCAELAVEFVVRACCNQVAVEFGKDRLEGVRICNGVFNAIGLADNQVVEERLEFHVENSFEESGIPEFYKVEFHFPVAGFSAYKRGLRLVCSNGRLDTAVRFQRMDAQCGKRVLAVKIPNGKHLLSS